MQNVLAFAPEGEYFCVIHTERRTTHGGRRSGSIRAGRWTGAVFVWDGEHEPGVAAGGRGADAGIPALRHPHTAHRGAGGAAGHSGAAKQLGHHGDGHRVRQRRADGAAAGRGRSVRGQCGHHHDGPAGGVPAGGLGVPHPVCGGAGLAAGPAGADAAAGAGGVFVRPAVRRHRSFVRRDGSAGRTPGLPPLDDAGAAYAAAGAAAGHRDDAGGAEQLGHHRGAAAGRAAGRTGRHPQCAGAGRCPAHFAGGQHRHDHHGGAGGGGSAYGCPADGGSALLLQPVGQRGLPAGPALDDKTGGGRLTQGAGAGSAGAADRQRPHPVQPAVHTGVAPADAGDGPAGLQTGAAAPKQNLRFFCKESRLSIDKGSRLVVY